MLCSPKTAMMLTTSRLQPSRNFGKVMLSMVCACVLWWRRRCIAFVTVCKDLTCRLLEFCEVPAPTYISGLTDAHFGYCTDLEQKTPSPPSAKETRRSFNRSTPNTLMDLIDMGPPRPPTYGWQGKRRINRFSILDVIRQESMC